MNLKNIFPFLFCSLVLAHCNSYTESVKIIREDWYSVYMMGMKAGMLHMQIKEKSGKSEKHYETMATLHFTIKHFSKSIEEKVTINVIEDADGNLVYFNSSVQGGAEDFEIQGEVNGKELSFTKKTKAGSEKKKALIPDNLVLLYQFEKIQKEKGLKPGTTYEYKVFDPLTPSDFKIQKTMVREKQKIAYFNESLNLSLIETYSEDMPGVTQKAYVDEQFNVWVWEMGIMGMTLYKTDEETSKKTEKNDFNFLSFIQPAGSFKNSGRIQSSVLKISTLTGSIPEIPEDEVQKKEIQDNSLILRIKSKTMPQKAILLPIEGKELQEYLKSNELVQSDHPEIKALAQKILAGEKNAVAAAKKLNHWVYKNIKKKNFNVLYDSALDVSRKLEGDCTEHSILFTALCRASGIPCRLVLGLVYFEGIYGYHQWAEAWLGEWVAMDPTFNQDSADATHIILTKTSLNISPSENLSVFLPLLKSIGNLKIEILEPKE